MGFEHILPWRLRRLFFLTTGITFPLAVLSADALPVNWVSPKIRGGEGRGTSELHVAVFLCWVHCLKCLQKPPEQHPINPVTQGGTLLMQLRMHRVHSGTAGAHGA